MELVLGNRTELQGEIIHSERISKRSARLLDTQLKLQRQYFFQLQGQINKGEKILLEVLPKEVLHIVFSFLTSNQLSLMCITSTGLRGLVEEYFRSQKGLAHLLPRECIQWEDPQILLDQFTRIGTFIKRSTCLYPTRIRLEYIRALIMRLENRILQFSEERSEMLMPFHAEMLNTVIAGWEDSECELTISASELWYNIPEMLADLMASPAGTLPLVEIQVRAFYRFLWLDSCPSIEDQVLRLKWVLRKHASLQEQAYLTLVLFAPTSTNEHSGKIYWSDLPYATTFGTLAVKDLGKIISGLAYGNSIRSSCPLRLYNNVTSIPIPWTIKARANLMLHVGSEMASSIIRHDMIDHSIAFASQALVQMAILSYQNTESPREIVRFMQSLCEELDDDIISKRHLIRGFWRNLVSRTAQRSVAPGLQGDVQLAIEVVVEMASLIGFDFHGIGDTEESDTSVDAEE